MGQIPSVCKTVNSSRIGVKIECMKNIVVVDIDGTIAKVGDRRKYITDQNPRDYDAYYEHVGEDEPIKEIIAIVQALSYKNHIVFCTGRAARCRTQTIEWLDKYFIRGYNLLMRKDGDHRHDVDVKPQLLQRASIYPNQVLCILEDRSSMVRKWRELGYRCLQVADDEF